MGVHRLCVAKMLLTALLLNLIICLLTDGGTDAKSSPQQGLEDLVEKLESRLRNVETRFQNEKEKLESRLEDMEMKMKFEKTEQAKQKKELEATIKEMERRLLEELEDRLKEEKDALQTGANGLEASMSEEKEGVVSNFAINAV